MLFYLVQYTYLTITAERLLKLANWDRRWRAFIPIWNLFVLGETVGVNRTTWLIPIILFPVLFFFGPFAILLDIGIYLVASFTVGIQLAKRTERPVWLGAIATLFQILGWPLLAYTAKSGEELEIEGRIRTHVGSAPVLDPTSPEARLQKIESMRAAGDVSDEEAKELRQEVLDIAMGRRGQA
jgi:hypothetical protein